MRHLNEIVRERNQYSRDVMEAWQDFINLKGRLDTELTKVTKRNNFLVEELESWKQQFLKFQAFAEQLTKETQDLKVKIESHKRENRRLTVLIDQQKDDAARLTVRLSGTEKQRDDALEALVLQQDIAEELERERKRNQKELAALKSTNANILRQRDESQRVVLHLRSLIDGQTHHMEHIVRSLNKTPDIPDYSGDEYGAGHDIADTHSIAGSIGNATSPVGLRELAAPRTPSRASENGEMAERENMTPEMEPNFFNALHDRSGRSVSRLSMIGVADRHLRDKTDAIADIIRNISEQCAAAVEGLQLAQDAELDDDVDEPIAHEAGLRDMDQGEDGQEYKHGLGNVSGLRATSTATSASETGDESSTTFLHPSTTSRTSSIPPTPDLVPSSSHNRSSTSMSMASASTSTQDRSSGNYGQQQQGQQGQGKEHAGGPKILEGPEEDEVRSEGCVAGEREMDKKFSSGEFIRDDGRRFRA